jgi:hypothetical protein
MISDGVFSVCIKSVIFPKREWYIGTPPYTHQRTVVENGLVHKAHFAWNWDKCGERAFYGGERAFYERCNRDRATINSGMPFNPRQEKITAATDTRWLDDLELTVRAKNVIINGRFSCAADVRHASDMELLAVGNCGKRTMAELRRLFGRE